MGSKTKIAVLGGGMGAMSAVYELLKADNFQGSYEIVIYQMGWRIGGKGASGRERVVNGANEAENNQRILEHGLHAWFGWYTNAFNQFKDCYSHLNWGPEHRFNTWDKAFTPEDKVVLMENIGKEWKGWELEIPAIPGEPGGTEELLTLNEYHKLLVKKLHDFFNNHTLGKKYAAADTGTQQDIFEKGLEWLEKLAGKVVEHTAGALFKAILHMVLENQTEIKKPTHPARAQLVGLIDRLMKWLYTELGALMARDWETKKFFTLLDVGLAVVKGLIVDDVLERGLNAINNVDFKEWLKRHGATHTSLNSTIVRAAYDCCFAYRKGNKKYPDLEAGVALRVGLAIVLGSKGHWIWKMNAGMGDTIFSPYYEVLKKYGVKFEFFHKVKELTLSEDRSFVQEIVLERQATLKPEYRQQGYQPTFNVGGVDCWPSEPFYDQLEEGDVLQQMKTAGKNVSLESFWSEWPGCADEEKRIVRLQKRTGLEGEGDFDAIVLNIPIAAQMYVCPNLIQNNPRWLDSILNVQTNRTFATQLWMSKTGDELGWKFKASSMTAFWEPVDTFCDMTHLLQAENWNEATGPKQITYLVGPYPDQAATPLPNEHTYPDYMAAQVKDLSLHYILHHHIDFVFPNADKGGAFNWSDLFDSNNRTGSARFEAQYWHVNIDPSERYTLSVKGSSAYRLRADESGYSNLFFTGDWTDNGVNVGCIEATVVSGMRCAAAICRKVIPVIGDNGLYQMT